MTEQDSQITTSVEVIDGNIVLTISCSGETACYRLSVEKAINVNHQLAMVIVGLGFSAWTSRPLGAAGVISVRNVYTSKEPLKAETWLDRAKREPML